MSEISQPGGEYPSEEDLSRVKAWPHDDFCGLMEFVENLWQFPEWGFTLHDDESAYTYELHTAGWSGNEEIISALQENGIFWSMCWEQTRRGGHYILKIRKLKHEKDG